MDALRAAGVDPATAEEHFCLQPWVAAFAAPSRLDSLPSCSSIKPQAIEPDPDPALD
ncbi:hypothetical protein ADUPG1_003239, partial [Aduncisulcus paluster]